MAALALARPEVDLNRDGCCTSWGFRFRNREVQLEFDAVHRLLNEHLIGGGMYLPCVPHTCRQQRAAARMPLRGCRN